MTRAEQCVMDRIHVHEFERARLVALRDAMLADEQIVTSLSRVLTTPAADLADTIPAHHQQPKTLP